MTWADRRRRRRATPRPWVSGVELLAARPDSEPYKADLAGTLISLGSAEGDLGRAEAAAASCTEALGLYRELLAARPDSESTKSIMARALNSLGNAQGALGRPEAAAASCTEALRLRRGLLAARPTRSPTRPTWQGP